MNERDDRRLIPGIALATALLGLPLLGAPALFDPDEGFYPAAAAESVDAGRPLDLTLNGAPRWEKPFLAYGLQQVSMAVLGRNEFAARLPSVLAAAALVAILGLLVARATDRRTGLFAAVVLASSLGHQVMGRAAHPEILVALGGATAQAVLGLWFVSPPGERPRWAWGAAGAALGVGMLAKGPAALLPAAFLVLGGMFALPREIRPAWRETGRVAGAALLLGLGIAAPWFLWMGSRHDGFWSFALGQLGHVTAAEHEHFGNHPLYFLPVLAVGFLPWAAFLPGALIRVRRRGSSPRERLRLLMAVAAGGTLLFWSLSRSKLPHYALVLLPPLAVVVAVDLVKHGSKSTRPQTALEARLPCVLLALVGLAMLILPQMLHLYTGGSEMLSLDVDNAVQIERSADAVWNEALGLTSVAGGLLVLGTSVVGMYTASQRIRVPVIAGAWLLLVPGLLWWWLAWDARERQARPFAAIVRAEGGPGDAVVVYRKRLPSMTFYLGRKVEWASDEAALRAVKERPGRCWIVLRERHRDHLPPNDEGGDIAWYEERARGHVEGPGDEFLLLRER